MRVREGPEDANAEAVVVHRVERHVTEPGQRPEHEDPETDAAVEAGDQHWRVV